MLPGYVSGFYSYDDCHIDLCRLATFARARLVHAEANGIDTRVIDRGLSLWLVGAGDVVAAVAAVLGHGLSPVGSYICSNIS